MEYEAFVERVREVANLETFEDADRAAEATLETLAECIHHTERDHLATQLPKQLGLYLNKRAYDRPFLLDDFYNRVAARADLRRPHAEARAHAVMQALHGAIADGEWQHLVRELPSDYDDLVGEVSGRRATVERGGGAEER